MCARLLFAFLFAVLCSPTLVVAAPADADGTGTLKGAVTLADGGNPLHKATVTIVQLRRSVETTDDGSFQFNDVPAGTYEVLARTTALTDERKSVTISEGQIATVTFAMRLATVREQVTVTASGREESTFDSFQTTNTVDSLDLAQKPAFSLGDLLDNMPGVAKRGFGVGNARPVVRGFDGDRVLILKDGIRTGSLSSQSGDHGESVDILELERVEIVRGPAQLLYGSNALGGVVNLLSKQEQVPDHHHKGISAFLSGTVGTANELAGGGGGFELGFGNGWTAALHGGGNRTGNYQTPIGDVFNSQTRLANGGGAFGWTGEHGYWKASYGYEDSRYGVPFAALLEESMGAPIVVVPGPVIGDSDETIQLALHRHNTRFTGGFRDLGSFVDAMRFTFDLSKYHHDELEVDEATGDESVGTSFDNQQFFYNGMFEQRRTGRLTGRFGFSGFHRQYSTVGAEAIAPPVNQNNFAFFALEEVGFERVRFQFGGRVEHSGFAVQDASPGLPDRGFTGASGAAGISIPLWQGGALVANYTHSYRSPAIEELYNNGPHPGNATFEIGNPDLDPERSNGVDVSLRHQSGRIRGDVSFFYYALDDFIFLAPTGNITDGLIEAENLQGKARYRGAEAGLDVALHPSFWLLFGLDFVDAETTSNVTTVTTGAITPSGTPLPRIPPLRGRIGFDWRWKGLSVRPEGIFAAEQGDTFATETRTAGYGLFNLNASYTVARQHYVQVFSVSAFNLTDKLYRNHLSFIKDLAPEIGRGVRFGYTVRFF